MKEIPNQVLLLIPKLATEHEGEVLATVAAIRRVLASNKMDLHDLVAALKSKGQARPTTERETIESILMNLMCLKLTAWEVGFVSDMFGILKSGGSFSTKQHDKIYDLKERYGI